MLCDCCGKNKVVIRILDVKANKADKEHGVCDDCYVVIRSILFDDEAKWIEIDKAIAIARTMLGETPSALVPLEPSGAMQPVSSSEPAKECPDCGMTLAKFKEIGRLGCARDYEIFGDDLEALLERIHDVHPARHTGRKPVKASTDALNRIQQLNELKDRLESAVKEEDFETAAKLRDEIKGIEETP